MRRFIISLFLVFLVPYSSAFAQNPNQASSADLQKQIQDLLKQVQILQQQVAVLQAELGKSSETSPPSVAEELLVSTEAKTTSSSMVSPPEIVRPLSRGSSGDDVRQLQEFLAQDKEIYPEGLRTGFFGPSTEAAIKRWQKKQGITALGIVGPKTIAKFKEFGRAAVPKLLEKETETSVTIPQKLLTVPGMQKRIDVSATTTSPATVTAAPAAAGVATTTSSLFQTATTTPSGIIPAVPAVPATPAAPLGGNSNATPATPAIPAQTSTTTATTTFWNQALAPSNLVIDKGITLHLNPPGVNYSVRFNYVLTPNTKYFRVYLKRPTSTNFMSYTYDAQVPLLDPSRWNESIVSPFLRRSGDSSWYWWPADEFLPGSDPSRYGEYKIYVTAVSAANIESVPSETKSIRIYAPPVISSPADGSTVSTKPTIAFTTGDSSIGGQYYAAYVYKSNGTVVWSSGAAAANFVYPGSELNPADNPHRLVLHSYASGSNFPSWYSPFSQITFSASTSPSSAATTSSPSIPQIQGLTTVSSGSSVNLSWQDVTGTYSLSGSPSNMFGSYNLYRGTSTDFTPSPIPSNPTNLVMQGSVLSYTDSNLSPGTYYYKIALQDKNGVVGPASTAVSAVVTGPSAPTNLQAVTTSGSQSQPPQMWYYLVFNYTLQSNTQSFNVYRKRPTDSSFVKYTYSAQTLVNSSILPLPASGESNLYHRGANNWEWWTTLTGLSPDAVQGEYKFYVTAVDTNGIESSPSDTKTFKVYTPPVISSPADGSTISTPLAITVAGDSSAPNPTYGMVIYKKTTGDTVWSAWPAPSTNFIYSGPALNSNDNPHRLVVWFSSGIYDRSLFGTSIFNVPTATTTSSLNLRARNLATVSRTLKSINVLLQKLLKTTK